jgi:HK97 family phage prohead protease
MKTKNSMQSIKHRQFGFKAETVKDDGTFSGYGSVFGNVDSYREIVAPGAFTDSLKAIAESGDPLPALWQHNSDQPIGGYDTLAEDDRGLKVTGTLLKDDIPLAAQAFVLMKKRIVKGMSIGYYVEGSDYNEKTGIRTLTKLDLVEVSIVTFPANPEALTDAIKSRLAEGNLPSMREFQSILQDRGFTKSQAEGIVRYGYNEFLAKAGEPRSRQGPGEPDGSSGNWRDALDILSNL